MEPVGAEEGFEIVRRAFVLKLPGSGCHGGVCRAVSENVS
jgi:hypothetical protein